MSLLPYLYERELFPRRRRLLDQHFGLDLAADDLLSAVAPPLALLTGDYVRPWRQVAAAARDLGSTVTSDKEKLEFRLDVDQFSPEEVSVKVSDGFVIVEGKHEEKQDEKGFVSRQFVRRYALPPDCAPEKVESRLSSDGVLTVTAPRSRPAGAEQRQVQVEQTGPARSQIKQDEEKTQQKQKDKK